jgi:hypothetical protein
MFGRTSLAASSAPKQCSNSKLSVHLGEMVEEFGKVVILFELVIVQGCFIFHLVGRYYFMGLATTLDARPLGHSIDAPLW